MLNKILVETNLVALLMILLDNIDEGDVDDNTMNSDEDGDNLVENNYIPEKKNYSLGSMDDTVGQHCPHSSYQMYCCLVVVVVEVDNILLDTRSTDLDYIEMDVDTLDRDNDTMMDVSAYD